MKKVFVVDDNFSRLLMLNTWFKRKGCDTRTFSNPKYLFDALEELLPDLIVVDKQLQEEEGTVICNHIKSVYSKQIPVIVVSANTPEYDKMIDSESSQIQEIWAEPNRITRFVNLILN